MKWLALTTIALTALPASFAVDLPDTYRIADNELVLNGSGLRKKYFLKIYSGGLYLENQNSDPRAIMNDDSPMVIRMHWLYGVSANQMMEAWDWGFDYALGEDKAGLQDRIEDFKQLFNHRARKGDVHDLAYIPGKGTEVRFNGKVMGCIEGIDFKKAVFAIWLGEVMPDRNIQKLKQRMLGK